MFLQQYSEEFLPILQDYAHALSKIVLDNYPESKKETANLIILSSEKFKGQIGYHSSFIFKGLAQNLKHQHSKVRKVTIEAIGKLLLCDGAGQNIDSIKLELKSIVNDKTTEVRKISYDTISKILNGFSYGNVKKYEPFLLCLCLNGLSDENDNIREDSIKNLEEIGLKRKLLAMEMDEKVPEEIIN